MLMMGWRNLFRNKRRTLTSLITVSFGAASLLIYQGFNTGLMNQYRENTIRVRFGHGQINTQGYLNTALEKPWKKWIQNYNEVEQKVLKIPNVVQVFPRVSFYSFLVKGGVTLAGRGEGVVAEREAKFFTAMNFQEGGDLKSPGEIILGQGLAQSLNAKTGDYITLLGQTIHGQLNGTDLKVVGIFHTGKQDFDNSFFRISLPDAQTLLDTDSVEHLTLQTTGVEAWPQVSHDILQTMPEFEPTAFEDLDAIYYKNSVAFLDTQFQFIRTIILLVVALGIFNTIAVGLLERASEIGALRANGESRKRLFKIFMYENAFLGLIGGILGIIAAVLIENTLLAKGVQMPPGPGITRSFRILLEIQPAHFVQAVLLPATTTVLASIWPVTRLLKRTIPDLLRSV